MTINISNTHRQRLFDAGYTDQLPMPIRATEHYAILSAEHIQQHAGTNFESISYSNVLLASRLQFPLNNQQHFELIIDADFLLQEHNLELHECSDFKISAASETLQLHPVTKFFIEIHNSHNFSIEDMRVSGGHNVIAVSNSHDFLIQKCDIQQALGYAIIIQQSSAFKIEHCLMQHNLASGIMVLGDCRHGLIRNNQCNASSGYFNFDAGIHLCATSNNITLAETPESCHEALSIMDKTCRPYGIVISHCQTNNNRAQGIYLEGAVNCLLQHNQLFNNNKEGICFDWGSSHCIFQHNFVSFNGARKNVSKNEIAADFISDYPLLEDNSSSMKLAGISIDNGCLNQFTDNQVINNFGDGIKCVRTAILNNFSHNTILFNSIGANSHSPFFYGIAIHGTGQINNEFASYSKQLLDFLPSQLNTCSNNIITGHLLNIYQDDHSSKNDISNNSALINPAYHDNAYYLFLKYRHTLRCKITLPWQRLRTALFKTPKALFKNPLKR